MDLVNKYLINNCHFKVVISKELDDVQYLDEPDVYINFYVIEFEDKLENRFTFSYDNFQYLFQIFPDELDKFIQKHWILTIGDNDDYFRFEDKKYAEDALYYLKQFLCGRDLRHGFNNLLFC